MSQNMLADMFLKAQIHALSLGFFASFAAPFGGFLSSAIKRAYGIKDNRGFGGTRKSLSFCIVHNIFNQSVVSLMLMLEYEIEFLNSSVGFTRGKREGRKKGKEMKRGLCLGLPESCCQVL